MTLSTLSPFVYACNECQEVVNDLSRLLCYDMKNAEDFPASNDLDKVGNWLSKTEHNPITGVQTKTLKLRASFGENKWQQPIDLVIQCNDQDHQLKAWVDWHQHLYSNRVINEKFDDLQPKSSLWLLSDDSEKTLKEHPSSFVRRLISSYQYQVSIKPLGDEPMNATFDPYGIEQALIPIRKVCFVN